MTTILTFETLYNILRKEKTIVELQELEKSFYQDINNYQKDKEKVLETQPSPIIKKQLENTRRVIEELYEKREKKLIQLAISNLKTKEPNIENILPEELELYQKILKILKETKRQILKTENIEKNIEKKSDLLTIRLKQPIPKFVDTNLKAYGPFEEEYMASVPRKIAEILIKNQKAEEIKST